MTNFEKYKNKILDVIQNNIACETPAIKNNIPVLCESIACKECDFNKDSDTQCTNDFIKWLYKDNEEEENICNFCIYASNKEDYPCSVCSQNYTNLFEKKPKKTRQDKFLEIFPNTQKIEGAINICPYKIEASYGEKNCWVEKDCIVCQKEYWLEEVEE